MHFSKMLLYMAKTWSQNDFDLGESWDRSRKNGWVSVANWLKGFSIGTEIKRVQSELNSFRNENGQREHVRLQEDQYANKAFTM